MYKIVKAVRMSMVSRVKRIKRMENADSSFVGENGFVEYIMMESG